MFCGCGGLSTHPFVIPGRESRPAPARRQDTESVLRSSRERWAVLINLAFVRSWPKPPPETCATSNWPAAARVWLRDRSQAKTSPLPHRGQLPSLRMGDRGRLNSLEPRHALPRLQPLTINPQQFTEPIRISPIRFRSLIGLYQHHLAATIFPHHRHEPIVEPTHLQDHHKPAGCARPFANVRPELPHPLPFRADLSPPHDVSRFVTHAHRQLLAVLIHRHVKRDLFSCR